LAFCISTILGLGLTVGCRADESKLFEPIVSWIVFALVLNKLGAFGSNLRLKRPPWPPPLHTSVVRPPIVSVVSLNFLVICFGYWLFLRVGASWTPVCKIRSSPIACNSFISLSPWANKVWIGVEKSESFLNDLSLPKLYAVKALVLVKSTYAIISLNCLPILLPLDLLPFASSIAKLVIAFVPRKSHSLLGSSSSSLLAIKNSWRSAFEITIPPKGTVWPASCLIPSFLANHLDWSSFKV